MYTQSHSEVRRKITGINAKLLKLACYVKPRSCVMIMMMSYLEVVMEK